MLKRLYGFSSVFLDAYGLRMEEENSYLPGVLTGKPVVERTGYR
ncbi:MAG: hypothetical protein N3F08_03060 [Crenarchaeota archaeon]|nr:hypothetical protein [Thermoproteota archaeon]